MQARHLSFLPLVALGAAAYGQDFNGDGYADLAIGVPDEDIGTIADCGAVHVLYGGPGGLSGTGSQVWDQGSAGLAEFREAQDRFGFSLAWGDVNGDGCDDLAVGVPYEDVRGATSAQIQDAGLLHLLFGGPGGLSGSGALRYTAASGSLGQVEAGAQFGYAVCIGPFCRNADGKADLAVGAPRASVGAVPAAGAVFVFPSPEDRAATVQRWTQGNGLPDVPEAYDQFGAALAWGALPNHDFLAIGAPYEDFGSSAPDAGNVIVIYCSPVTGSLRSSDAQLWVQGVDGDGDQPEPYDHFGACLATGLFSDPARGSDLAVGAPGEDLGGIVDAGAVSVIYHTDLGGPSRLYVNASEFWTQDSYGLADVAEAGDAFGSALAVGCFSAGQEDLAIGVPGEDLGGAVDAGAVQVLQGGSGGLAGAGSQFWTQDSAGIADAAEAWDRFGQSLAGGDFDGDGHADLAIGVPCEDLSVQYSRLAIADTGALQVLYAHSGLLLEAVGSQFWSQDSSGVQDSNEAGDCFGSGRYSNP